MRFFRPYCLVFLFPIILILSVFDTTAQSRQSLEEQRKSTLREIDETNRYLQETRQSQKESLEKLNLLNVRVGQYKKLIDGINAEIDYADRRINEAAARVKQMSRETEKLKSEYAQLLYHAYTNRGKYNKLIYVLSAKDFNEAYRRMNYFRQYGEYRKRQVAEIVKTQEELSATMEQLAARKAEKEKLLVTQREESRRLEVVKTEQNKEVDKLKSQERQLRRQLAEQQRRAQKLQRDIEQLIASEAKKRKGTSTNLYDKLTPEERLVSNNFKDNRGRLPWPVEKGIITGYFGINPHPLYKDIRINNNGIDITTVGGAGVRAVFGGEVTRVWGIRGENIIVVIRHGNYMTVYQNLVDVSVKQGDKVKLK